MKTTYTFRYGLITVEVEGNEEENHKEALESAIENLQELDDEGKLELPSVGQPEFPENSQETVQTQLTSNGSGTVDKTENEDSAVAQLARKANVSPSSLAEIVDIDPEREEAPFLLIDSEEFGDSRAERQMNASLVLLSVWAEVYEEERVKSSNLKDALNFSDIDEERMEVMYSYGDADAYFDKSGRGPSATLGLTRRGKREGYETIRNLV